MLYFRAVFGTDPQDFARLFPIRCIEMKYFRRFAHVAQKKVVARNHLLVFFNPQRTTEDHKRQEELLNDRGKLDAKKLGQHNERNETLSKLRTNQTNT